MSTPYAGVDSLPATIPLPEDSVDKRSASVMNACLGPLMDFCRWLYNRLGSRRATGVATISDTSTGQLGTDATSASFRSPPDDTNDVLLSSIGALVVGDKVEFALSFHAVGAAIDKSGEYRVHSVQDGIEVECDGALAMCNVLNVTGANTVKHHMTIVGGIDIEHAGTCSLYLQCRSLDGATAFRHYGPYSGFTKVWRSNS